MEFAEELLPGTWIVRLKRLCDERGSFVKTYSRRAYDEALGALPGVPAFESREEFYSTSAQHVIRGMHFQLPPHAHAKLVYCAAGRVDDVLLDLRRGPDYGRTLVVPLDAAQPVALYIPVGVAHGFCARTPNCLMVYKTSTEHAPTHDSGIRFNSFGHDWKCAEPIVSARDRGHPAFSDFVSPF